MHCMHCMHFLGESPGPDAFSVGGHLGAVRQEHSLGAHPGQPGSRGTGEGAQPCVGSRGAERLGPGPVARVGPGKAQGLGLS